MGQATGEVLYEVRGPKTLLEMTWEEVEAVRKASQIALIPLGSTESHGIHLPMGADTFQGYDFARGILARLAARGVPAVSAPCLPFGVNYHMMPFPGTLTLSADTMRRVILEVGGSLVAHGFTKLALVLGHGGNFPAMQIAAQELVERHDCQAIALNWLPYLTAHYHEILSGGAREGHGGASETARMLVSAPRLVHLDRAQPHYPAPPARKIEKDEPPVYGGGVARGTRSFKSTSPYGHVGDPSKATRELGERIYAMCCDWMTAVILREFVPDKA
ncbi:MAG: creatininase family protein [Armatimonadota bacterium]|nr:creatininase family protein [Armatimonadota bacterium]